MWESWLLIIVLYNFVITLFDCFNYFFFNVWWNWSILIKSQKRRIVFLCLLVFVALSPWALYLSVYMLVFVRDLGFFCTPIIWHGLWIVQLSFGCQEIFTILLVKFLFRICLATDYWGWCLSSCNKKSKCLSLALMGYFKIKHGNSLKDR